MNLRFSRFGLLKAITYFSSSPIRCARCRGILKTRPAAAPRQQQQHVRARFASWWISSCPSRSRPTSPSRTTTRCSAVRAKPELEAFVGKCCPSEEPRQRLLQWEGFEMGPGRKLCSSTTKRYLRYFYHPSRVSGQCVRAPLSDCEDGPMADGRLFALPSTASTPSSPPSPSPGPRGPRCRRRLWGGRLARSLRRAQSAPLPLTPPSSPVLLQSPPVSLPVPS